jgi:putative tricarboxylic transport membrane protein
MHGNSDNERAVVSTRTMEVAVAIGIMVFAAIVMVSNFELGAAWGPDGPEAGYFPFYVGVLMFVASAMTLIGQRVIHSAAEDAAFVDRGSLWRVLQILVPTAIYTVFIVYIGIYVASAIFIAIFMIWLGRYRSLVAIAVAAAIALALFLTFEVWFLVPLPKGPLETWLGY